MTRVGPEPHAALPASERVAATRRAAQTELVLLRRSADGRRLALLLRDVVDPGERISRAAEWRARALTGFDRDKGAATRRNLERFAAATTGMLRDVAALPGWIGREPPAVREAIHAAGLLGGVRSGFEQAAAGIRATVVPSYGRSGPASAPIEGSGVKSLQLPSLIAVTGRNAT